MRLWHVDILPYLPDSQLNAQWRELGSICYKQDNHLLINYIYCYNKEYLYWYTIAVLKEKFKRGFKTIKWDNFEKYFEIDRAKMYSDIDLSDKMNKLYKFYEHDNLYLKICYYNLLEKYKRGQKDFTKDRIIEICKDLEDSINGK